MLLIAKPKELDLGFESMLVYVNGSLILRFGGNGYNRNSGKKGTPGKSTQGRIQVFPSEGTPTLGRGAPTYKFASFSHKLHEIKKILVPREAPPHGSATGTARST